MGGLFDIVASLSWVSQLFILAILAAAILFNLRYTPRVVELGPTILTTLGIFGTFLGVAIGLSHFDTGNVQASVPALLAGLKTAFWASVFGVGAAVQLKMREFLAGGAGTRLTRIRAPRRSNCCPISATLWRDRARARWCSNLRLVRQDLNDRLLAQIRAARQDANERLEGLRGGQREMVSHMDSDDRGAGAGAAPIGRFRRGRAGRRACNMSSPISTTRSPPNSAKITASWVRPCVSFWRGRIRLQGHDRRHRCAAGRHAARAGLRRERFPRRDAGFRAIRQNRGTGGPHHGWHRGERGASDRACPRPVAPDRGSVRPGAVYRGAAVRIDDADDARRCRPTRRRCTRH